MNSKLQKGRAPLAERADTHSETLIPNGERPYSVRYYWSPGGTICSGHSVAFGKTRSAALAAFFAENPHVQEAA
jgi:hypothetical protein